MKILALLALIALSALSVSATTYTTSFPNTENPISEGGNWQGGSAAGGSSWGNVQTTSGLAFGVSEPTQYGDPTAILTGTWGADQTIQGTVSIPNSDVQSGTCCHEIELRLRMTIKSGSISGYEAYCSIMVSPNQYCHIARWNGPNGSYCNLDASPAVLNLNNGDVLKATATGSGPVVITLYVNGVQKEQISDSGQSCSPGGAAGPFTSGNPGIGFYDDQDTKWSHFGFSSFTASSGNNAATCNASDVQSAVNSAAEGDTVLIPAGTCTWTSGVTISGKGIMLQGSGSGRIVAYSADTLTVATGSKTINIAGYSPGLSSSVFTSGQTMTLYATGNESLSMKGTVSSFSNGVLTMNISSTTGSGSTHRWIVATQPSTVLVNNSSTAMLSVTEDATFDTNLSGFKIAAGTGSGDGIDFNFNTVGKAIVLENCWISQGNGYSVSSNTNRGVISNCSFDAPTFSTTKSAFAIQGAPINSWTIASTWGGADTTGQANFYVETNDYHAYTNATNIGDSGRVVFRYNLMNNAGFGTTGADTSNYGQRYFEYYGNTGVFNGYSDGTTFNLTWWINVRGGSFVAFSNSLPQIQSGDFGSGASINMTVMNLQSNTGPNPCWGAGTSGGADYHAPRQVGMGYVTGTGKDGKGQTDDSVTYVGDSEPGYIWGNTQQPLGSVIVSDFGGTACSSPDTSTNYIVANRDYFNGSTAKPGYTPYTYPHPLLGGSQTSGSNPSAPTGLTVQVH